MFKHTLKALFLLLVLRSFIQLNLMYSPQDKIVVTPTTPGNTETTWLDLFSASTKIHIDFPAGTKVPPTVKTDIDKERVSVLARKLKVLSKDGDDVQNLQVVYLKVSDLTGVTLPPTAGTLTDLGESLSGKTYQINCKDGTTSVTPNKPISDEQVQLLKRECTDFPRAITRGQTFSEMKVGDVKSVTAASASLFSDDVDQIKIDSWDIKLNTLDVGPPAKATFGLVGKADTSTQTGKAFPEYKGEFVIDDKGSSMELRLTSSTTNAETLPDKASQVVSKGSLNILFKRQFIQ
jgi:hypothetical protein